MLEKLAGCKASPGSPFARPVFFHRVAKFLSSELLINVSLLAGDYLNANEITRELSKEISRINVVIKRSVLLFLERNF